MSEMQKITTEATSTETERVPSKFEIAATSVLKLTANQALVLDVLRQAKEQGGLTDYELETAIGSHISTYRMARAKLVERGLVVDSGVKRYVRGKARPVWKLGAITI